MLEKEILADVSHSTWLREALRAALACDPLRVANDAELLAGLLRQRVTQIEIMQATGRELESRLSIEGDAAAAVIARAA
jgi:hypothetical protein